MAENPSTMSSRSSDATDQSGKRRRRRKLSVYTSIMNQAMQLDKKPSTMPHDRTPPPVATGQFAKIDRI